MALHIVMCNDNLLFAQNARVVDRPIDDYTTKIIVSDFSKLGLFLRAQYPCLPLDLYVNETTHYTMYYLRHFPCIAIVNSSDCGTGKKMTIEALDKSSGNSLIKHIEKRIDSFYLYYGGRLSTYSAVFKAYEIIHGIFDRIDTERRKHG